MNLDPNMRYYALHKPAGVVTTMKDPQGRPDIRGLLPDEGPRVFPVGRLDRDSEGLLLLTNDGDLANRLMHPSFGIEKEYLAEVEGTPDREAPGPPAGGRRARGRTGARRPRQGRGGEPGRGAVQLVMTEGRKREVRRMLDAVGLPVTRLVRLRVGGVRLGRLAPGDAPRAHARGGPGAPRAAADG